MRSTRLKAPALMIASKAKHEIKSNDGQICSELMLGNAEECTTGNKWFEKICGYSVLPTIKVQMFLKYKNQILLAPWPKNRLYKE